MDKADKKERLLAEPLRILLVEDNPGDARLVQELLKESEGGFSVTQAQSLSQAVELSDQEGIDVALLDLGLPDSQGLETFRRLKAGHADLPIVVLTGLSDLTVATEAAQLGAQDYLIKGQIAPRILECSLRMARERQRVLTELKSARDALESADQEKEARTNQFKALNKVLEKELLTRKQSVSALEHKTRELHASNTRFYNLIQKNVDCMLVVDTHDRIQFANAAAKDIFGRPAEELLGTLFSHPLKEGSIQEVDFSRQDGTVVHAEVNAVDILWKNAPAWLASIRNVTRQKMTEKALKNKEEELLQAQKMEAVGRLAGGIAHDFNNLITIITGFSNLILDRLDEKDPLQGELEEIRRAGERAAGLTRQLLAFSRKQVLKPEVLDLNHVVSDMEKMLRRVIGEDVELVTYPGESLWRIRADRSQVEQVVMNLAVNARDAMPDGGKLILETKNVVLDQAYSDRRRNVRPGEYVRLAISDTGSGIDKAHLDKIFDPFFTTKGVGKGTGLGLSTVYGIIKQSEGNIWAYSEPGHGTTFKVYLPRTRQKGKRTSQALILTPEFRGQETILLAEDDEGVRSLITRLLRNQGYEVLVAGNGGEAVLLCENHPGPIHILLTDVVMPGMDGKELFERLRSLKPDLKVLFMSGYTDDAVVHRGILEPNTPFLEKPFTPREIMKSVRTVLDGLGSPLSSEKG